MIAFATGQRVRVRWSGKIGIVRALGMQQDEEGDDYWAALVSLDPFVARFSGDRPSCLTTLEGIYALEDLEEAAPGAVFSYPVC